MKRALQNLKLFQYSVNFGGFYSVAFNWVEALLLYEKVFKLTIDKLLKNFQIC
ncbi:MAG: hypothetical protein J7L94_07380 [Caldisericaceae bacterium]|nr:hypothetical protein [Caldisericaceae bacterium]